MASKINCNAEKILTVMTELAEEMLKLVKEEKMLQILEWRQILVSNTLDL